MTNKWPLVCLDWFLCSFVLSPLCVLAWRGSWKLLDLYVYPSDGVATVALSIGLGAFALWLDTVILAFVGRHASKWPRPCRYVYLAAVMVAMISFWRGTWMASDLWWPGWRRTVVSSAVAVLVLVCLRSVRNLKACPLTIGTDDNEELFSCQTLFQAQAKKSLWLFLLDVTFSVVVVGSLVVFVWRGVWSLLDVYLFPESSVLSCISSLAIGYAIVLLTFALQYQAAAVSRRCRADITRILWEDFFLLIASFGGINVWRGIWMVADVYIYPDNPVLSCWITHTVGMLGSILLYAGNTILARGVDLDGEFKDGSGCIFDTLYLRQLLPSKKFQAQQSETDGAVEMVPKSKNPREDKANGGACKQTAEGDHCLVMMDGNVNKDPGQPMLSDTTVSESAA